MSLPAHHQYNKTDCLKYAILLLLLYIPLFSYLDELTIRLWDESRLAVNAYEMFKNKNYIVTYFGGQPDLWNTKPPLMIWAQVFFMKILGVNELSVRLPSALAALATCIGIVVFSLKYIKSFWLGAIAVLVLVTIPAYVGSHVTRTGDYDALLTLFTTMAALFLFSFIETKKTHFLYWFFLMMALGVLTKGITPLLFGPAFAIYLLIRKQFIPIVRNKHLYIGIAGFLLLSIGYYLLREAYNPGYLAAVKYNEMSGRFMESLNGVNAGFWIYFTNLKDLSMPYWVWFIIPGIIAGLWTKNEKLKQLTLFSLLLVITFLLVISGSETKFNWYVVPALPFLAIIIAAFPWRIIMFLKTSSLAQVTRNILAMAMLILLFFKPYTEIINYNHSGQYDQTELELSSLAYALQEAHRNRIDLDGFHVVTVGYLAEILFYIQMLNEKGVQVSGKAWENIQPGDRVIFNQTEVLTNIDQHYEYNLLSRNRTVHMFEITNIKQVNED
jgi:4-amino-4-deoxy-L-arabinose transferase-like glycosyltransferase